MWLPEVTEMAGTDEVAGMLAAADLAVVLHEDAQIPLAALPVTDVESIVLVVGPEGGLSDEELERFAGAEVARIGTSVLRTSTAGVVAVAVLLSRTSRWG